ncbi:Oxysterol-binding protein-related protein 8 [Triplophysa tibetana]|uniref:Oxysterol-binding protein-related protein 8 n=1 Tax=Triplophysa tibetana TaxID=1572043 RepID=A0A5A9PG62_9TELE|nr:Oxysterol-binding protein-related protein 8 [Triplophysa tibetana]
MMKQEGILGRRRFSTCGGTISVRPPHHDGRKLIRNASFGGYNELSVCLPGFDRSKEEILPLKEDSLHSISKSKSETKLYNGSDKDVSASGNKLTKKESLKVQKKNYREEKKRATKELLSTITDPSVIVMADWLKIRGTLKSWTKLWCVLKPGVLLIYKTNKNGQWVGTVLLNACELIERPSKKDGFCFKLFHPLEQSIWAVKGPKGEAVGSITQPLPSSHLIFRAASESDGRCWMDALELALKCSSLLKRTMIREGKEETGQTAEHSHINFYSLLRAHNIQGFQFNDSDQFKDPDLYSDKSDRENEQEQEEWENEVMDKSEESDSDTSERQEDSYVDLDEMLRETVYIEQTDEELGEAGEASQTETVSEENKSLIWTLLKQVRPGMDLSKVVLPTFILEPRSFLDKLSDYYFHADFLSEAAVEENAYNRMKKVVKWYISGFYKKPKGLKKPYNPIIGETFRCLWIHTKTNSKTFYIAEQPFLGSSDIVNQICGKIKLGKEVLATLEGHWDSEIFINDKKTGEMETFWNPTPELRQSRLTRCNVPPEEQSEFESERLWQHVTRAINNKDQTEATNEKFILEEAQRKAARERKAKCEEWTPGLFEQDPITGEWHYRYADTRPWDPLNDLVQFEKDGCIQTKVRHRTPMVRSASVVSLSTQQGTRRDNYLSQVTGPKRKHKTDKPKSPESGCSSPEPDRQDSSGSERHKNKHSSRLRKKGTDLSELQSAIESIRQTQENINRSVNTLRGRVANQSTTESSFLTHRDVALILFLIFLQREEKCATETPFSRSKAAVIPNPRPAIFCQSRNGFPSCPYVEQSLSSVPPLLRDRLRWHLEMFGLLSKSGGHMEIESGEDACCVKTAEIHRALAGFVERLAAVKRQFTNANHTAVQSRTNEYS